jgi:hypothetical protein
MQSVDRFSRKIIAPALKFLITLLAIIFLIFTGNVHSQRLSIVITEPKDGKEVCWRSMVKGTVSDPKLQVFVAIHPMATNKFWIQPIPNMRSDGKWEAYCYFGEPNIGIGEPFEIIAIVSKNKKLFKEVDTLPSPLPDNPQILVRSNPIVVKRVRCLE